MKAREIPAPAFKVGDQVMIVGSYSRTTETVHEVMHTSPPRYRLAGRPSSLYFESDLVPVPAKTCVKCHALIRKPVLADGEAELCARCGDPA